MEHCVIGQFVLSVVFGDQVLLHIRIRGQSCFSLSLCVSCSQCCILLGMACVGSSPLCVSLCGCWVCFCCCSSLLCASYILSGIMTFKPLKSKRTNTTNDKSNRRGLAEEHDSSPPKEKKAKGMPPCACLDICIYKITDKACNCWSRFEGSAVPLWQVAL